MHLACSGACSETCKMITWKKLSDSLLAYLSSAQIDFFFCSYFPALLTVHVTSIQNAQTSLFIVPREENSNIGKLQMNPPETSTSK